MRNRLLPCLVVCLGLPLAGRGDALAQQPAKPAAEDQPPAAVQQPPAAEDQPPAAVQQPPAAAKQPGADAVRRLIAQLSSKQFAVRERATEQLIVLGLPAVQQLELASRSENREVRHRSQLVLTMVHELDFRNRLRSFEQDADGENSYGLPGWERFRELAGNTLTVRSLFAQMQKAERDLLTAETKEASVAAVLLDRRCQRLRFSTQIFGTRHELPPIAAALFVATNQAIPLQKSTNTALMNLCQQLTFENAINKGAHRTILQNLLAGWILREDAVPAHEMLLLALQHNISQSLPRARTLADQAEDLDLYDRHFAVLCLAKFGGPDDVPRLEEMMSDQVVISRYRLNSMTYTVEMRDLVLASLLTLSKQEPSAFGYGRMRLQEPFVFDSQSLGFATEDERQLAIEKWRIYRGRPEGR